MAPGAHTLAVACLLASAWQALGQVRCFAGKLEACTVPRVEGGAFCGRYEVYENRAAGTGRRIGLNVVVLPALTSEVAPDPLVFLAGGGVAPVTRYAAMLSRQLAGLRRNRDILLLDQRGTWNSGPLACEGRSVVSRRDEAGYLGFIRQCREDLERRADLRLYTTPLAMNDLDEIRGWLGYERINYGVSYGSKAAQVYLRQHPERVRAAVLHGVVPLGLPFQLELARSARDSLEKVFRLCAGQAECRAAFPNLRDELNTVLTRLAKEPAGVRVDLPDGSREVRLDDREIRDFINGSLGSARFIVRLPLAIHQAVEGDYKAIAAVAAEEPPPGEQGPAPLGVFLSILCAEEIARIAPEAVPAATAGSFFGDFPIRHRRRSCCCRAILTLSRRRETRTRWHVASPTAGTSCSRTAATTMETLA